MKSLLILTILATHYSTAVFSQGATYQTFDIIEENGKVCTVEGDNQETKKCYIRLLDRPNKIEIIEEIEARKELINETGSYAKYFEKAAHTIYLSREEAEYLTDKYDRLSLRNIAVNPKEMIKIRETIYMPIVFDLYWQGALWTEGTLHAKGHIKIPADYDIRFYDLPESYIEHFSDSKTEYDKEVLRNVEKAWREIHFYLSDGSQGSTDQKTSQFLQQIISKALSSEFYYKEILKQLDELDKLIEQQNILQ